jgi:4a-hydroxytetrahydrobiopterin dehydratase
MSKLSTEEIDRRLETLDGWARRGDKIVRRFDFADFVTAFGWMASVALVAERMNHHPDWKNVYGTVEVELWSHDVGGLTARDFRLAGAMDRLAAASSGDGDG